MVRECKDRLLQEGLLYFGEGNFVVDRPLPLGIFVCEGKQWFGEVGESGDELPIEVAESDEGSDCFYIDGACPVSDSIRFGGVHFYGPRRDKEAEVFDLCGVEGAFGEFKSKSLFTKSL